MEENIVIDTENVKKKADKNITTDIAEGQEDDEVFYDETFFATENTLMTTADTLVNETTDILA